jgi:AmmeMemoRadiSam system protein B
MGALFMLCDGTRTLEGVRTALLSIFGIRVSQDELKQLMLAFDEAYLLENKRFEQAYAKALSEFREAANRSAAHAGISYPADPNQLTAMLNGFHWEETNESNSKTIRGIISPHIDFARGGVTYANTWNDLRDRIQDLELAIVFGTDHHGQGEIFTLTRQDYATPFGNLPTYQPGVDMLVDVFGETEVFSGELRHRTEHSVEFAAVWLQHVTKGSVCPMLPILCDALPIDEHPDKPQPGSDSRVSAALDGLRELIDDKKTLVVAAGDLSHVGPAFGGDPIEEQELDSLTDLDSAYIQALEAGDATRFHRTILTNSNRTNVCGTAPFVHTLNLISPTNGMLTDYRACEADPRRTSWVSICGMHLH